MSSFRIRFRFLKIRTLRGQYEKTFKNNLTFVLYQVFKILKKTKIVTCFYFFFTFFNLRKNIDELGTNLKGGHFLSYKFKIFGIG